MGEARSPPDGSPSPCGTNKGANVTLKTKPGAWISGGAQAVP